MTWKNDVIGSSHSWHKIEDFQDLSQKNPLIVSFVSESVFYPTAFYCAKKLNKTCYEQMYSFQGGKKANSSNSYQNIPSSIYRFCQTYYSVFVFELYSKAE